MILNLPTLQLYTLFASAFYTFFTIKTMQVLSTSKDITENKVKPKFVQFSENNASTDNH